MTLPNILAKLKNVKATKSGWMAQCPAHDDEKNSLSVKKPNGRWLLYCHAGCDIERICGALQVDVGALSEPKRKLVKTYDYVDEGGAPLFQVCRYEPKYFLQRRPDGGGGWMWKLGDVRRVLYRLPELIEGIAAEKPVIPCEGEKDADRLASLGFVATCNPGGAGKWRPEYNEFFRGADVVLTPDNDEAGWKHVNEIGAGLTGIAARIRVLMLPGLPGKGDISDWLAAGGTREQLDALIEVAPDWVPPPSSPSDDAAKAAATASEDELLNALARMRPGVEYARRRQKAAESLGVPQDSIDDEVKSRRSDRAAEEVKPLYGHWSVDPWPEVVDGAALLRDIVVRFHRHIVISPEGAITIALWVMLSWVHNAVATHSPILDITSAEPECGKTSTMGLLAFLMPRCIATVDISKAALYRSLSRWHPSFCIDEFDNVLAGASTDENKAELRSVINGGHTRGTAVIRCLGDDKVPEPFDTFGPKAIGMNGKKLPPATLGRCVVIEMRRRKSDELIDPFKHVDDEGLAQLRQRLARWSINNETALRVGGPPMPPGFENRRADNWRLQLAIADLVGGDWGDQARTAAVKIERAVDKSSIGTQALTDIRKIFAESKADCLLSATIVEALTEDPDGPWAEYSHGQKLTQGKLARLLKPYGIVSMTLHPPGVSVKGKGYRRWQFEDAWERYLPGDDGTEKGSPPP